MDVEHQTSRLFCTTSAAFTNYLTYWSKVMESPNNTRADEISNTNMIQVPRVTKYTSDKSS